jgi:hypothetical protein
MRSTLLPFAIAADPKAGLCRVKITGNFGTDRAETQYLDSVSECANIFLDVDDDVGLAQFFSQARVLGKLVARDDCGAVEPHSLLVQGM